MRGGSAWRLSLFAILLSYCRADDSSPAQSQDNSDELHSEEILKSGAPKIGPESDESLEGDTINLPGSVYLGPTDTKRKSSPGEFFSSFDDLIKNYPYQGQEGANGNGYISPYNVHSPRLDSNYFQFQPRDGVIPVFIGGLPRIDEQDPQVGLNPSLAVESQVGGEDEALNLYTGTVLQHDPSELHERETLENSNPEQVLHHQISPQPVIVVEDDQYHKNGNIDLNFPEYSTTLQGLISKPVISDDLIHLHNIPGGKDALTCSEVGQIHHLWANGYGCMVCVCLKESIFKSAKPVCATCAACVGPVPEPHIRIPVTLESVTIAPSDAQASCKPLPKNEPFQSPLDPCKLCICTESIDVWGQVEATIQCQRNPECVIPPDGSTSSPLPDDGLIPLHVCEKFPKNVLFPHPWDGCKLCKCSLIQNQRGQYEQQVTCIDKPDCLLPVEPFIEPVPESETIVTLPPYPQTASVTCSPIPSGVPFQNPLNPCQVCICTETTDPLGRPDVFIKCEENLECVQPPDVTIPPIDIEPIPLASCSKLPTDVPFPHPRDSCKTCKCSIQLTPDGLQEFISCYKNPECEITPEPFINPSICDRYPPNTLFPDPQDECKVCKCTLHKTIYGQTDRHINCYITPECSGSTLSPVTLQPLIPPNNNGSCAPLPSGRPFQNPLHPCQVCVCHETWGPHGPDVQIECQENPHCVEPLDVTPVPPIHNDVPVALPICGKFPPNILFPHPRDPCRVCKCTVQETSYGTPREYITCFANPDCESPLEPFTISTPETAEDLACKPLPSGRPFQSPLNPCEICMCMESLDANGKPDVRIDCRSNPQCVVPPDTVTAVPLIPDNEPVPLPICGKFPSNVLFPHPREACRVCKCTLQVTSYGTPREHITCFANPDCEPSNEVVTIPPPESTLTCKPLPTGKSFQNPMNPCEICVCIESLNAYGEPNVRIECQENPQCVIPPEIITVPPIPDNKTIPLPICGKFPPNVLFPHPRDPCRVCKCTVQETSYGTPREYITCYANPDCETTPKPISWPPAPLGPLPGPSPHESCSPYAPDKPFQHPWDECQVCVCSEAFSIGHITIEVNCFTKKSCCIEIPFDLSELPSSSTGPYIIRPRTPSEIEGVDGSIAIGADGQQVNLREILDPSNIGHYLKPTGNLGPYNILPEQKHMHRPNGDGSIYIKDQSDLRNRAVPTSMTYRGPIKVMTNPAQNGDLLDIEKINLYNQQMEPSPPGYKQYKIPGYIYSGDVQSQYRIPDIRSSQWNPSKYTASANGPVMAPGYTDQRHIYEGRPAGSELIGQIKPYILSEGGGQEYKIVSQGNLKPRGYPYGYLPVNGNKEVEIEGPAQNFNVKPNPFNYQFGGTQSLKYPTQSFQTKSYDWMKLPPHGLISSSGTKFRGSERMRTKSGRPGDSSQSEEASGVVV